MSLHKATKEVKIVPIFQSGVPVQCSSLVFQSGVPVWCSSPVHAFQTAVEREREKERIEKASGRKEGRDVIDLLWNSLHPQF